MPTFKSSTGTLAAAILAAGAGLLSTAPGRAQGSACGDSVVVAFGDSLSGIARRCGASVGAIMAVNPLLPGAKVLVPGMTIRMPRALPGVPPEQGQMIRYAVRAGDTLRGIARTHGVALADIYRLNPGISSGTLQVGEVVRLPAGVAPPPPSSEGAPVRYSVRPGDTLPGIARARNLALADIYRLNPGVGTRTLRAGDVIRLPATTDGSIR